jgi:hypothetical protein
MRAPVRVDPGEDVPPQRIDLALPAGITFGGVVRNEAGEPVGGAQVQVDMQSEDPPNGPTPALDDVVATTGSDGRWSADVFPASAESVALMASHPDYVGPFAGSVDDGWIPVEALRKREAVSVLKRGRPLEGVVTDSNGRPVAGAQVVLGAGAGWVDDPPAATTDAQGRYRFDHVGDGKMVVTGRAAGRAPDVAELVVREGMPPTNFRLGEGSTLRLRVTDAGSGPVAGAMVVTTGWRGRQNLAWNGRTDRDGRVTAADLPADEVRFTVSAPGRMSREVALKASTDEQAVELHPTLRVSGSVADAESGKPVAPVEVISGFDMGDGTGTRWDRPERTTSRDGRYERTFDAAQAGYQIRFEAEGYVPQLSRKFTPDEGPVSYDVKLAPVRGPAVVVVGPDGKPAAGVQVIAVGTDHNYVAIQNGNIATTYGSDPEQTGKPPYPFPSRSRAGGGVDIALPAVPYVLVASGEQGYASLPSDQVPPGGETRLTLKPWRRVVGSGLTSGEHKAGQIVTIRSQRTVRSGALSVTVSVESYGSTDADGHFKIEKCVAGPAVAGRMAVRADQRISAPDDFLPVEIPRDRPELVLNGTAGTGRSVSATIVPPDDFTGDWSTMTVAFLNPRPAPLPLPKNWIVLSEAERQKWLEEYRQTDAGKERARQQPVMRTGIIGTDGSLRFDDVQPGSYTLSVQTGEPRWGAVAHEFEVTKEGKGPVELGKLELLPRVWPKAVGGAGGGAGGATSTQK